MLPSKKQWGKYSLINKLTVIGAYAGIVGIVLTVVFFILSNQDGRKAPGRFSGSKPSFRITYFNLGGHAIDFLLRGQVDKEWEAKLSGQPFIVPNAVLRNIRHLITNFSSEVSGDTLFVIKTANKSINLHDEDRKLRWFFGTDGRPGREHVQSHLPESTLINTVISAVESAENWNLCWDSHLVYVESHMKSRFRRGVIEAGYFTLWKFFDRNEFLRFFGQKLQHPDKTIELYKYVTKQYTPPEFFVAKFMHIECPGYMALRLEPRPVQLRVAVIENVGTDILDVGSLYLRENKSDRLRTVSQDRDTLSSRPAVKTIVFPQRMLKPGEKLLIPLEICFRRDKESLEEHDKQYLSAPPKELEMIGDPEYISVCSGVNEKYERELYRVRSSTFFELSSKTKTNMLLDTEYIYGPSVQVDRIEVDKVVYPFRHYDPEKLVMQSGDEKGCCPYVYTYSREAQTWISEGHVLYGNNSKAKERLDQIHLKRFDGRVQIKENDPEVSYIDFVQIKAKKEDGSEITIFPKDNLLKSEDGKYRILKQGEGVEVDFDLSGVGTANGFSLIIKGYYIPYVRGAAL